MRQDDDTIKDVNETDQDKQAANSDKDRPEGGGDSAGTRGSAGAGLTVDSGDPSMNDIDMVRAVLAEREKMGVGAGTADSGVARTTGVKEEDDGTAHRQGLSRIIGERQPRADSHADMIAAGESDDVGGGSREERLSTETRTGTSISTLERPGPDDIEIKPREGKGGASERSTAGGGSGAGDNGGGQNGSNNT